MNDKLEHLFNPANVDRIGKKYLREISSAFAWTMQILIEERERPYRFLLPVDGKLDNNERLLDKLIMSAVNNSIKEYNFDEIIVATGIVKGWITDWYNYSPDKLDAQYDELLKKQAAAMRDMLEGRVD